jgi:hypothetical protein
MIALFLAHPLLVHLAFENYAKPYPIKILCLKKLAFSN